MSLMEATIMEEGNSAEAPKLMDEPHIWSDLTHLFSRCPWKTKSSTVTLVVNEKIACVLTRFRHADDGVYETLIYLLMSGVNTR